MRMRYESVDGDPYFLFGVNADICAWISGLCIEIDKYHQNFPLESLFRKYPCFLTTFVKINGNTENRDIEAGELTLNDYVLALGKRDPYKRREKCLDIIKKLWASHFGLGPYPLLDELISFENNGIFYSKYRDHAAHQLMNYLLGLYIYYHCEPIRSRVNIEIRNSIGTSDAEIIETEFILRWFIASIIHDVGYVMENSDVDPSKAGENNEYWKQVKDEINETLKYCLSKTPKLQLRTTVEEQENGGIEKKFSQENVINDGLRFAPEEIELPKDLMKKQFFSELDPILKACGIVGTEYSPFNTYYELARGHKPSGQERIGFLDHGISSALILLNVCNNFQTKMSRIIELADFHKLGLGGRETVFKEVYKKIPDNKTIIAAAQAIALHNINKDIWGNQSAAFAKSKFDLDKFFIMLQHKQDNAYSPSPLAFLLALVDTLQDWHRPRFNLSIDQQRSTDVIDKDISIRFENDTRSEKILLYYRNADEYEKIRNRLLAFLDKVAISELIELNTKGIPQFLIDRSFSRHVDSFEECELRGVFPSVEDDYTMEKCLLDEDAEKILEWGDVDLREILFKRKNICICPENEKLCNLRIDPLVTLTELGRCSLALQDTLLLYRLFKELKIINLRIILRMMNKPRFDTYFADSVRRFGFALKNIPRTFDRQLKLKNFYNPPNINGFLTCRVDSTTAQQFSDDYDIIKNVAEENLIPAELFNELRLHTDELESLDDSLTSVVVQLGKIIEARTSDTESEIKKHVRDIKEIKPLGKLYDNINQAFPHLKNKAQEIW